MENDNQLRVLDKKSQEQINIERTSFYSGISQSETDFEKKITYISVGSLALSLTFLDKIVDIESAEYYYILIIAWILLGLTLSINLASILLSRRMTLKSLEEYDNNMIEKTHIEKTKKRNKLISSMDFSSLLTLLIGIFLIVTFCSLNLGNTKKNEIMPEGDKIEKGRIIQTLKPNTNSGGENKENSGSNSGNNNGNGSSGENSTSDKI